jgi:hypothetical protein
MAQEAPGRFPGEPRGRGQKPKRGRAYTFCGALLSGPDKIDNVNWLTAHDEASVPDVLANRSKCCCAC